MALFKILNIDLSTPYPRARFFAISCTLLLGYQYLGEIDRISEPMSVLYAAMGKEIGSTITASGREDVGPARIGLTVTRGWEDQFYFNRPFADSLSNSDWQPKKDGWPKLDFLWF